MNHFPHESLQKSIFGDVHIMLLESGLLFTNSSLLKNDDGFVKVVYNSLIKSQTFRNIFSESKIVKSNDTAVKHRMRGNEKFKNKEHLEALKYYTQSILFAENGSSYLGLAYANRSAVLFERKYYKECLQDIMRALESEYPEQLKPKLLKRQLDAERLKPIQKPLNFYRTIPSIMNKNPIIDAASDAVEIQTNEKFGRHIVATKDIQIGEIIAVERPYVWMVDPKERLIHCQECSTLCYNMIPCTECTVALYCSKSCKMEAFRTYHKYECNFVKYFQKHALLLPKMAILGLQDASISSDTDDNIYHSTRIKEIKKLATNENKRDHDALLILAVHACLTFHCLKNTKNVYIDFNLKNDKFLLNDLFKYAMVLGCNGFGIARSKGKRHDFEYIGEAVYSFCSLFNHSCVPNCDVHFHGSYIVIRAGGNINKGSQCTITYGFTYYNEELRARQKDTLNGYFFRCDCEACINKWPTLEYLPLGQRIPLSFYLKAFIYNLTPIDAVLKELLTEASNIYNSLKSEEPCRNIHVLHDYIWEIFNTGANQHIIF